MEDNSDTKGHASIPEAEVPQSIPVLRNMSGSHYRQSSSLNAPANCILTFQSLLVSLRTTGFNIQKFYGIRLR